MDDDGDPYESLPPETPAVHHMMAGSLAGIAEHCLMYPVDVVKTRMMCIKENPATQYKSITDALRTMVRQEGWGRPVRGVPAVFVGAGPAHAMYFAGYEKIKRELTLRFTKGKPGESSIANALAGGSATLLHDAVMNPAEVVKQRMQMFQSPYKNCRDCFMKIYQSEGSKAFYRSYTTALTMNVPFQVTHFVIYEKMQDLTNRDRHYNPGTHMVSGAVAGGAAAAVTTPMDVCRTLLNTQQGLCTVPHCVESPLAGGSPSTLNDSRTARVSGMFHAVRIVYVTNGVSGFFKGCRPRVIYQMPATAISWACYESFKHFLLDRQRLSDDGGGGGADDGAVITSGVDVSNAGVFPGGPEGADSNSNKVIINIAGVGSGVGAAGGSTSTPMPLHPSNPNSSDLPETMTASATTRTTATTLTTLKPGLKPLPCPSGGLHHVCAASTSDGLRHSSENESFAGQPFDAHSIATSTTRRSEEAKKRKANADPTPVVDM